MQKNNKGFSLVELIISVAILGIITLSASAFMAVGSRTYSSLNYTVRLQYESQLAMSQLQEYLLDCSAGIAWDDGASTLYVVDYDEESASGKTVYLFVFDEGEGAIYFGSGDAAEEIDAIAAPDLMAEHVKSLHVTFSGDTDRSVTVDLEMERQGKHYQAQQVIALRNEPPHADSWDTLWGNM